MNFICTKHTIIITVCKSKSSAECVNWNNDNLRLKVEDAKNEMDKNSPASSCIGYTTNTECTRS